MSKRLETSAGNIRGHLGKELAIIRHRDSPGLSALSIPKARLPELLEMVLAMIKEERET